MLAQSYHAPAGRICKLCGLAAAQQLWWRSAANYLQAR
jgi:hypothetical protein